MITGHGNDKYLFEEHIIGDFSSNIAYNNYSDRILRYVREKLEKACNYPDPKSERLTEAIALHHGIPSSQVLVTAGSAEAFYMTAHHFAGAMTTIAIPSFAEYEDACALFGHQLSYTSIPQLWDMDTAYSDTIWWGSPNNPDGVISSSEDVRHLLQSAPQTHFVIDCAYTHLSEATDDLTPLHSEYPQLITIHSLTKAFDIPGLRLGYIIASPTLIEQIRRYQIPWSVNAIAQEAGLYIMEHYSALLPDIARLIHESQALQKSMAQIPELEVHPSETNYFLIRMKGGNASELKHYLVREHGLLIRDASNFRGLTPQHFRVAVQSAEYNALLLDALKQYFSLYAHH